MDFPSFYDPRNADRYDYDCVPQTVIEEALQRRGLLVPSLPPRFDVEMVCIDQQRDFGFRRGSLFVGGRSGRGALDDNRRISEFIYRNAADIAMITPTLDTHSPVQIFFSSFWNDADGNPVPPNTEIRLADIKAKRYRPSEAAYKLARNNRDWVDAYVVHYCESLERAGRYTLFIWPIHCLAGSIGHTLVGVVQEAILYHSWLCQAANQPFLKGGNPWTEEYSALGAEVTRSHDGKVVGENRSASLVKRLLRRKAVIIAGEAASHCVKSTVDDLIEAIKRDDTERDLAARFYILEDCMSSVVIPGTPIDFTPNTEEAFERYRRAGMHIVKSTTPMAEWPGMPV